MFATLSENDNQEQNPFEVPATKSENDLIADLENDEVFQRRVSEQKVAIEQNQALTEEIYSILQEMEGTYYSVTNQHKYFDWDANNTVPYTVLRRLGETEPARMIKNKRRLDLSQYGKIPREDGVERGCRLAYRNPNYRPSKEEKVMLKQWEQRIVQNFFFPANEYYPNFSKFLGNAYEDFFDLDDITTEIRRSFSGTPVGIHLGDPRIFKPVIPKRNIKRFHAFQDLEQGYFVDEGDELMRLYWGDQQDEEEEPDYLVVHQGRKLFGVTRNITRKFHFFTRSDFRRGRRGFSIAEQGMSIATHIINAIKMNSTNFTNNRLPKGFIHFSGGGIGTMQLEKLKKLLYAHMSGVNPNRFPMIATNSEKGDAKWVGINGSSREMEYHLWITLLFSVWCQLSGTDPRELSMGAHTDAIGKKSLFEESSDGIVKESKDLGAKTFLVHIADSLNAPDKYGKNLFQELTGLDVEIEFFGFEVKDKKLKQDVTKSKLETHLSFNDILAEQDKEAYNLEFAGVNLYDVPGVGHPSVMAALNMKNQQVMQEQAMQQQAGMQGSPEGEEGGYTDEDKALLEKYGNSEDVEIDEDVINDVKQEKNERPQE